MSDERNTPATDPLADLAPQEVDYADEITEAVAAMEPEEWMPEPPVGSMAPDVAMARQQLERALNAHLGGGGVEVRADGAIAIDSHLIMVETDDLVAAGKVVVRSRGLAADRDRKGGESDRGLVIRYIESLDLSDVGFAALFMFAYSLNQKPSASSVTGDI